MSQETTPRMAIPPWLWPAFAVPAVFFFVGLAMESEGLRLATKSIPVLVLAAGVWLSKPRIRYRKLVAAGLLFSAAGDLLLELDLFEVGLASFLVAQTLYISAFVGDSRRLEPVVGIVFLGWGAGLTWALAPGAGDLLVPVAVYAIALTSMMWRAVGRIGSVPAFTGTVTAVGAVLFGISDSLIAIDRFGPQIPGARWWIMASYWAAQGLIAHGAMRRQG